MITDKKKLIVVIHAEEKLQVIRNANVAKRCGADGVFLINHRIKSEELVKIYKILRDLNPFLPGQFWIGFNFLDLCPKDALNMIVRQAHFADGLWTDNAGQCFNEQELNDEPRNFDEYRKRSGWDGLYFGGVAFKGQRHVQYPAEAAGSVASYMDVVTTSGPKTGYPPTVDKIKSMKRAIEGKPLAIASGISVHNVLSFLPYTDYFLVASSISCNETELDPSKVSHLADTIHIGAVI